MRLVKQEEVNPLQQTKLTIDRVRARFRMIRFREGKNFRCHFFTERNEILHDLPEGLMTVVQEKRIGLCRIAIKSGVVSFKDLPDAANKYMLVGLQVYDIFKYGPFARYHLSPDLLFG